MTLCVFLHFKPGQRLTSPFVVSYPRTCRCHLLSYRPSSFNSSPDLTLGSSCKLLRRSSLATRKSLRACPLSKVSILQFGIEQPIENYVTEGFPKNLRMANLACIGSRKVNGVAEV